MSNNIYEKTMKICLESNNSNKRSRRIMKESLRDFKPSDFGEFAGAMNLPSNKSPLIYEGNYATVLVSGSYIDPNYVTVNLVCDNGSIFVLKQDVPENQAIRIANELIKYVDDDIYNLEVVAKRNRMEKVYG